MQVPNRSTEMLEIKTSKRKEDTNACATLMTYNLPKEAASKQNNTREVWRLDPKQFSSWTHLVRVHARVRRVLHNMCSKDNRNANMELSPEEMKDAEEEIMRLAQRKAFRDEYTALSSGMPIPKKSQLLKLNLYTDKDGVIQCDSRLKAHVHPRGIARRAEFHTVENSENYQQAPNSESNPHSSSSFPGISLFFVSLSFV